MRFPHIARPRCRAVLAGALALALATTAAACTRDGEGGAERAHTLRVVAGSEIADMEPILHDMERQTGIRLDITYVGTLDGTQQIAAGQLDSTADAAWFPSNKYLALLPGASAHVKRETKIMYSPVVLGVKQQTARALGWDRTTPTWEGIVSAVRAGRLRYGMTSPASSNSGFSTLIEAATALSGTGDALTDAAIARAKPGLVALSKGQTLTSGSSGWLADRFTQDPSRADAIFNYESVLRGLRVDGKPLRIVVPSDGVITADYPLTLLSGTDQAHADLYDRAVAWLTSDDAQRQIAARTHRNTRTDPVNSANVFELPFPGSVDTVRSLISAYLSDIKKPSQMVFAIDVSWSMEGERLAALQKALGVMTSSDAQNSFLAFRSRESVRYVTFAGRITGERQFDFDSGNRTSQLAAARSYIDGLRLADSTAVYTGLERAYERALAARAAHPDTFVSVVLFTDGETNTGPEFDAFRAWYEARRSRGIGQIPAFVVRFGESSEDEMRQIAELTGGRVFDGSGDLTAAFTDIRGYQ